MTMTLSGSGTIAGLTPGGLPDASIQAADLASGAARTNFGAGAVLQVVQTTKQDTWSTLSGSFTAITGLSASITPRDANSKILVQVMVQGSSASLTNAGGAFRLYRDGSHVTGSSGAVASNRTTGFAQSASGSNSAWKVDTKTLVYLDSPASASSMTYQVYARAENLASGTQVNYGNDDADNTDRVRLISTITLMEIAG